jgi:hypothetical protein
MEMSGHIHGGPKSGLDVLMNESIPIPVGNQTPANAFAN